MPDSQKKRHDAAKPQVFSVRHWSRLLVILCVAVLAAGTYLSLHTLNSLDRELQRDAIEQWQIRQLLLLDSAATGIESVIQHWEHTLQNFAKLEEVIDLNTMGKRLFNVLYHDHPDNISSIGRMDRNGVVIYSYPEVPEAIGAIITDQQHIQKLMKTHEPVLSGVFLTVQGYRAIAYHYPVFKDGEFDGSVGVLIPFEKIASTFLEPIKPKEDSHVWLFDENDTIIYGCGDDSLVGRKADVALGQPHPAFTHKFNGNSETRYLSYPNVMHPEYDEGELLYAVSEYITMGNSNWHFVLSTPENLILESVTSYRNTWAFALGLLLTAGFVILASLIALILHIRNIRSESAMREESNRLLEMSERKFRLLAENAREMIFRYSLVESRYTYISPACESITGYTPEEAMAFSDFLFSIAHPEALPRLREEFKRICRGHISEHFEFRILDKHHTIRWLSVRGVIIPNETGELEFVEGIISDITGQKTWEQQLVAAKEKAEIANRAKSEFLAMMSHELRTPLNPVVGFCDLLISEVENDDQRETLQIMKSSSEHLLNIIGDIIDIATIESGEMEINYYPVELESFLEQTLAPHRVRAHEKKLTLSLTSDNPMPGTILVDGTRLRQVINHLLSNAIKFTPQGTIEMSLDIRPLSPSSDRIRSPHTHLLTCSVKDTGIGVEKEKADTIFEPFSQADTSSTRAYGGTGLGLTICKRIVQKLGGSIRYQPGVDGGSIFAFEVEVDIMEDEPVLSASSRASRERVRHMRTLCVEDDPHSQLVVSKYLHRMAIQPDLVSNGLEAMRQLGYKRYDLILLDIHLPDMDGIRILEFIQSNPQIDPKPYVLVLTADVLETTRSQALKAGAARVIHKPVRYDELLTALTETVE